MPRLGLPPETRISEVALTARDAGLLGHFYSSALGLEVLRSDSEGVVLSVGGRDRLRLVQSRAATRPLGSVGLYHFAILFPSRESLGSALARFHRHGGSLTGAADHLVSEALYLTDPEGNGVELYRDRPRGAWPREGSGVRMGTLPLDPNSLLDEAEPTESPGVPPDTRIGHIHLHVHEIEAAERFYGKAVGFDLMQRFGSSASFLGAGGYHHHVGVNTWGTLGAQPAPPESLGLSWFTVALPDTGALEVLKQRLDGLDAQIEDHRDVSAGVGAATLWVRDPSGHRVAFRADGEK